MSTNGSNGTKRPVSADERDAVNAECKAADGFSAVGGLTVCRILHRVYSACGCPTFKDLGNQLTFSRVGTDKDGNAEVKTVGRSESWVSRRLGRKGALAYARDLSGDAVLATVGECSKAVKAWTPDQHAEFLRRLHGKAVETVRSGAAGKRTGARKSRGWAELIQAAVRKATDGGADEFAVHDAVKDAFIALEAAETAAESQANSDQTITPETVTNAPEPEPAFASQLAAFLG